MSLIAKPRVNLAFLPTPVETLENATKTLNGPKILIKRDDQTGLALGGNKTRKLEYLVADALNQNADTLLTTGTIQSNHCRQTAAAANKFNLRCELILRGKQPNTPNGNLLLDYLLNAKCHWIDTYITDEKFEKIAAQIRQAGRKPYIIPTGGSNAIGALGYVNAMLELAEQQQAIDHIVFASSSGGTHAGLVVGAHLTNFTGKIHGVRIDKDEDRDKAYSYEKELTKISNDVTHMLGIDKHYSEKDFIINREYTGEGYAVMGSLEKEAINFLAKEEGILLDPVYTGRAFGGLLDLIKKKTFSKNETVLFWHTGGAPALFAYAKQF